MSGTLVVLYPDGNIIDRRVEKAGGWPYDTVRNIIGNIVQPIKVRWDGRVRQALVDEEGLIRRLPHNKQASDCAREFGYEFIVGPCVIWVPDPKKKKPV